MLSFWPGFQGLARYGLWSHLCLALLFGLLLNAFLIAGFYWTAVLTPTRLKMLAVGLVVVWTLMLGLARVHRKNFEKSLVRTGTDETYRAAIVHYLGGNWIEAESLIVPSLKKHPRDVEMLLLQATLYRHTKRYSEALSVLSHLQLLDASQRWFLEIEQEHRMIQAAIDTDTKELEQA